ncbi:sulfurtransferase TusA family protein [Magnetospirillum sp. 64-120]|uniref:sulfurtransferase TusA family protein n=1 Tax=Magnetospirillum sp. 64-120 TaxID=1895778 RepID=UPI00092B4785|nr:sulfurtransferase TusA family protein [Magnetospirillum sp. 64-120]OJX81876.1 MAG: SirA protein [Magnetospirillum sp. 64-120]
MTEQIDHQLDITSDVCPMTFVRAKLLIEKMLPGKVAEIRLKGSEPLNNVPRSLTELGHEILSMNREEGESDTGVHRLVVRKK